MLRADVNDVIYRSSLRLSRVLDDIGISKNIVYMRRETYALMEKLNNEVSEARGWNFKHFYVGSQREGSVIPGTASDVDILSCNRDVSVWRDWADWENGRDNRRILQPSYLPPQHCVVQLIRDDKPLPIRNVDNTPQGVARYCHVDDRGRILLLNTYLDHEFARIYENVGLMLRKTGPSKGWCRELDFVPWNKCRSVPDTCMTWIDRRRPGHWPTLAMLEEAKTIDWFIIPAGHPDSPTQGLEWRFAPNLIERMLFLSLRNVHVKCYVVLKMIKETIFKPLVGDNLTSFHLKTVLFRTVEQTPDDLWNEENLIKCIHSCIITLYRFLKAGVCPHFILTGLDVFAGKLRKHEQIRLANVVRTALGDGLENLIYRLPEVGARLSRLNNTGRYLHGEFPSRYQRHKSICDKLDNQRVKCIRWKNQMTE
ncbi:uncharacterized protein LOC128235615 [Mya arenaria]|uniref:uncharacterized protein LOC128235615 n=1 Tax=Mya arenaria TaxID=6604 RepID=UPI0022E8191F|nr:uncharacterized protein LOC128235615 [Mya arenaria]